MKRNVNRLFALLLAVVMVVAILPVTAKPVEVEAAGEVSYFDEVVLFDNFENATISGFVQYSSDPTKGSDGYWQTLNSDWFENSNSLKTYGKHASTGNDSYAKWEIATDAEQGKHIKMVKTAATTATPGVLYAQASTTYKAEAGVWYRLSWKAKVDSGSGKSCIYLRGCHGSGAEYGTTANTGIDSTEWKEYSFEFKAKTSSDVGIWFGFEGANIGTAYFDDFKLEKIVDPYPVVTDPDIVTNDFSENCAPFPTNNANFALDNGVLKQTYSGTGSQNIFIEMMNVVSDVHIGVTLTYQIDYKKDSDATPYWFFGVVKSGGGWIKYENGKYGRVTTLTENIDIGDGWYRAVMKYTVTQADIVLGAIGIRAYIGLNASNAVKGDTVLYDNLVISTEGWTVEQAIAAGKQLVLMDDTKCDIDLGTTGKLDLNGYKLTAGYVSGQDGSQITDSSVNKSGRIDAEIVSLSPSNPQLPVKDANGNYALANVNLGAAYIQQQNATEKGFTFIFRPGFGTNDIVSMIGSGNSGVSMSLNISWTDVFGETPAEPTEITGFDNIVASAYSNKKAIYAWFTNPGDTHKFTVQVVVKSVETGVTMTSDVSADPDATYINPAEAAKTYLFVNNFNDDALVSGTGNIYSTVGDKCLIVGNSRPTFDGSYMLLDGGTEANQLNLPFYFDDKSTVVMELDLRYVDTTGLTNSGKSAFDLLAFRNATPGESFRRYVPLYLGSTAKALKFRDYKNQVSAQDSTPVTNGADLTISTDKVCNITNVDGEWTHIKVTINYATNSITLEVDGVVVGTAAYHPLNNTGYAYMARYKEYDSIAIDNMKIYYTTPAAD